MKTSNKSTQNLPTVPLWLAYTFDAALIIIVATAAMQANSAPYNAVGNRASLGLNVMSL